MNHTKPMRITTKRLIAEIGEAVNWTSQPPAVQFRTALKIISEYLSAGHIVEFRHIGVLIPKFKKGYRRGPVTVPAAVRVAFRASKRLNLNVSN